MHLSQIISGPNTDPAFIVGNGINRYPNNPDAISWERLLLQLWQKFVPDSFSGTTIPRGITLTEFYDILDLSNPVTDASKTFAIQKEAAAIMGEWTFQPHHLSFVQKAKELDAPILTTNFDTILPGTLGLQQFFTARKGFTDFYPWSAYFGDKQHQLPTDGFGIWYINGFVNYHRSIRLGLSHYMGCVERARELLHKDEHNPFYGKNMDLWSGRHTWLHIFFKKDLCIFGLSLDENEVFIRWLLIERARYFKKFPERARKGWYVAPAAELNSDAASGKRIFMKIVGLELVETANYHEIYRDPWL